MFPRSTAFRGLFASATLSGLGDGITACALPLLAATLSRDPVAVAAVVLVERLPYVFLGLPAGAIADRMSRTRVMALADGGRFVVIGSLALAVASGYANMALLYIAALLAGTFSVLFASASHAVLPQLVERDDLTKANSVMLASEASTRELGGPVLGAVLFGTAAALPFVVDSVTFLVSGLILFLVASQPPTRTGASMSAAMRDGLAYLRDNSMARKAGLLHASFGLFQAMTVGIMVLYVTDELALSATLFGFFLALGAAGSHVGALGSGWLEARFSFVPVLVLTALGGAISFLVMAASPPASIAAVAFIIEGACAGVGLTLVTTLRQKVVDNEFLGRVTGVIRSATALTWGLGALIGGVLADAFGLPAPFLAAGVGYLGLTVWSHAIGNAVMAESEASEVKEETRRRTRAYDPRKNFTE